jgi:hypothetical protein
MLCAVSEPSEGEGFAVVHYRRLIRCLLVRSAALLSAAGLLLALASTASAQRVLDENWAIDGASQSIQLFADQISTWKVAGQQIFLLQGAVVVTQGANEIRSTDGVVWVDMARYETEHVMYLVVYGENPIALKRDRKNDEGNLGYVRLATTGKVEIKPFKAKLAEQDRTVHPVYQRALVSRPADVLPSDGKKDGPLTRPMLDPMVKQVGLPPGVAAAPEKNVATTAYFQMPPEPKVEALGNGPPPQGPPPPFSPAPLPVPSTSVPGKPPPRISIRPRYFGNTLQMRYEPDVEPGLNAFIVVNGVTIIITSQSDKPGVGPTTLDIEADRCVIWRRGATSTVLNNTPATQSVEGDEIYLAGHVELRSRTAKEVETLRADEVYYDVRRGAAVARKADLEIQSAKLPQSLHFVTDELLQVNPKLYKMPHAMFNGSKLPSDPGLRVDVDNLMVEEFQRERSYFYLFPAYDKDGKRVVDTERIFTGNNFVARLEDVPFIYFPYYRANVERPLGPLDNVNFSYNKIFGFQIYSTWDLFDLLNLPRPEGQRWRLMLDYLTERGPGFGTEWDFEGKDLFGVPSKYTGMVRLYNSWDRGQDILGGDRGNVIFWPNQFTPNPITHPDYRGWANAQINVQELPDGFSVLGRLNYISDRNYIEQYYLNTHLNEMNLDTFLYVKQQQNNWNWSLEGQVNTQPWLTQNAWLPRADGNLLGQTFFDDWLVYNARASAGYAQLRPTDQVPFAYLPTDVRANTLRLDLQQEVSLPFYLGPVKLAPYLKLDAADYTEDVNGNNLGRLVGGAGIRWNLPLSRIYPDVCSELFNLNQIYHKINLWGNYYYAQSTSGVNSFPQLDRLSDDSSDQALRDIRPLQPVFNPTNAAFLTTSNLFNPQNYAIRRLVDNSIDTLDSIDVLQLGINQRWQTKRGFPGSEHVVDWMTLNVGVSIFPQANRDNYGHTFGIVEYDWVWNIGDRTALTSSGWFDPFSGGARVFDVGGVIGRPDTTALYLGYRQIDPLNSKAIVASVVYPLSAKYAVSASTVWDFGNHISTYSLFLSRMGTDLMVSFGLSYNSTVNTFGVAFEIMPNIARPIGHTATVFPTPLMNLDPMVNMRQ